MKAEDYSQGDAFQTEKRTIFTQHWLPACAEGQIARPGDFQAATVGGWSIVAVRGADGEVRVLRNACRHQNMPVAGTPSGNCQSFRCRFHGWTYDLAGRFVSAPPPVAPPPSQTDRDLIPLAMIQEAGLVFFSISKPGERPHLPGDLPAYGGTVVSDIACNWKICIEHLLGRGRFVWPLLFVQGTIVRQVVPHTFLRTRLFTHVFGDSTADATTIKEACERLQAERASGVMPAEDEFHRRLAAATE